MSLRRFFGTESDKRVPERAKERGRAGASTVDRKLAAQRALVAVRLREAQQEGALLPQRVCLLMEGQETGRGEPARRRHHAEGSASGAAAMWKGDRLLGVGGWAEATAEVWSCFCNKHSTLSASAHPVTKARSCTHVCGCYTTHNVSQDSSGHQATVACRDARGLLPPPLRLFLLLLERSLQAPSPREMWLCSRSPPLSSVRQL